MMSHGSQEKVWLSELCPKPISFFNSRGTSATTSSPNIVNATHGKQLCDVVYAFHEPQGEVVVEIVFIHGLEFDGSKEAYWKTWLARDGMQDNCWPETWLMEEFPHARILSLSYDANVKQTSTSGRMDPYSLGVSLVQQMTLVGIGQHECPVVIVCHSFGGLVAKQIVVTAYRNLHYDKELENLLRNLRAFYFYATPHVGVQVDFSPWNPFTSKGSCMSYLEVFCLEVGRLNFEFEQIHREAYNNQWMYFSVGESHATSHGRVVVPESSVRQVGGRFMTLDAGHFDICRPKSKIDSGYLFLIGSISKVIKVHEYKQRHLLDLPNGLVGLDDMKNTICEKLHTVSIIGVVGMGGIGKTTISKYVYNLQAKFYDKTCFLQDVRSRDLAFVQKELLEELCGEKVGNIDHVSPYHLWSIKQCIMERRVLIVIDDVGDSETLKALQVPTFQRSLSSGSRVIVTCRNRQVLENHVGREGLKDVEIVDVEFLNDDQALKLFRYHVFHGIEDEDDEMEDFEDLSKDIAMACCGLPLSLEVIGQHLQKQYVHPIGKRKELWVEALEKLHEAQSFEGGGENEVLWKRLKISYDDLDCDTKNKFLDFACVFCEKSFWTLNEQSIGWIWNSSTGLQNLLDRSLIKVDRIDKWGRYFTIHDQLRDMGRRIVKDLSLERTHVSLEYMTRLWEKNEIENLLEKNEGSKIIEGISLRECFRLATLQSQANQRLNQELTIKFCFGFKISLQNYWRFPTFQLEANLGQEQEIITQRYDKLRLLNLENCRFEVVKFFLKKCWKELSWLCLSEVHDMDVPQVIEAIGFCTGLRVLQVRNCQQLKELPASIGNLVHLLELDLFDCTSLHSLPHEIGQLKQLRRLQLFSCTKLKEIPPCVSQLIDLQYLGLQFCMELINMVEFETQMGHLYELDLSLCDELRIPFKSLGKLHQLRKLDMSHCDHLVIENPYESFRQLSRLEKLNLIHSYRFIPGLCLQNCIGELTPEMIERLWDPIIQSFSSRLQELRLSAISQVGFPKCLKLKVLEVHNQFHLEELPTSLGDLTQLRSLIVWDNRPGYLKKLPTSLLSLVKLEVLELHSMEALDRLPDKIGHLRSLKTLEIDGMKKMEELPTSLGKLSQLKCLKLLNCVNLKCLPMSFTSLTQLSTLNLDGCHALEVMDTNQEFLLRKLKQLGCCISLPQSHQG